MAPHRLKKSGLLLIDAHHPQCSPSWLHCINQNLGVISLLSLLSLMIKSQQTCLQNTAKICLLHSTSSGTLLVQGTKTPNSTIQIGFSLMTETYLPISSLAHLRSIFHIKEQQNMLLKNCPFTCLGKKIKLIDVM